MGINQSQDYGPTPRFFSVGDEDMKDMITQSLEARKQRAEGLRKGVGLLKSEVVKSTAAFIVPHYGITIAAVGLLLHFLDEKEALEEKLLNQKIDRAQTIFAVNTLQSDLSAIGNRVNRIRDDDISAEDQKLEVVPAFDHCEKVLHDFENTNFVFYKYPLATAPCLIAFAQLYASVLLIGVELIPTYANHADREKNRLKKVLEAYKENTIKARLEMIKIVKTVKMPLDVATLKSGVVEAYKAGSVEVGYKEIEKGKILHDVDIVKDGFGYKSKQDEWHYWDRAVWDQRQGSENNHEYTLVVRAIYGEFFDEVISLLE